MPRRPKQDLAQVEDLTPPDEPAIALDEAGPELSDHIGRSFGRPIGRRLGVSVPGAIGGALLVCTLAFGASLGATGRFDGRDASAAGAGGCVGADCDTGFRIDGNDDNAVPDRRRRRGPGARWPRGRRGRAGRPGGRWPGGRRGRAGRHRGTSGRRDHGARARQDREAGTGPHGAVRTQADPEGGAHAGRASGTRPDPLDQGRRGPRRLDRLRGRRCPGVQGRPFLGRHRPLAGRRQRCARRGRRGRQRDQGLG